MNSTQRYQEENEAVFSLPREIMPPGISRSHIGWSVRKLLLFKTRSAISTLVKYPLIVSFNWKKLLVSYRVCASKRGKKALVLGNGPSSGLLSSRHLQELKSAGGELICVNNIAHNPVLRDYPPSWLVLSDPNSFDSSSDEYRDVTSYLINHDSINILCPLRYQSIISWLPNKIYVFIDLPCPAFPFIHPLLPRGYTSMTLYKALAWSVFLEYDEIAVLGMDNTYVRDLYNSIDNHVCNRETHAFADDFLVDQSSLYSNVASALEDIFLAFRDLELFPNINIVNLDKYSLTDRFSKTDIDRYFFNEM